jgi:phage I-like protein
VETNGAIWADVTWTGRGEEAVKNLEYRYISPVFRHNEKGEIEAILRAALCNNPNIDIESLNSEMPESPAKENRNMDKILAALGLPATATENDAVAAIARLNTQLNAAQGVDLAAYAPRADLSVMETRAVAAEKQLAELNAAALKKEAEAMVDQAVKDRKISPASKAEYLSLCATQDGLGSFKKIVAASPAIIGEGAQAPAGTPPGSQTSLNAEESAMAKAAGYTPEEWKKFKAGETGQEAAK